MGSKRKGIEQGLLNRVFRALLETGISVILKKRRSRTRQTSHHTHRVIPDLKVLHRHTRLLGDPPEKECRGSITSISLIGVGLDDYTAVHTRSEVGLVFRFVVRVDLGLVAGRCVRARWNLTKCPLRCADDTDMNIAQVMGRSIRRKGDLLHDPYQLR